MGRFEERSFRYYWMAWLSLLLGAIFVFPNLWIDRGVWVAFFAVEIWAAFRKSDDDTLSEFAQWLASWAKPGARWWQSWNAMAAGVAFACSYHAGYVASFGYAGVASEAQRFYVGDVSVFVYGPNLFLGVAVSIVIGAWLLWHFVRADKTG